MNQGAESVQGAEPRAPERAELRALFEANFDFVWRSLRRLGVPEPSLRDASQQVWIVVGRKIDAIEPAAARSFLFGTAVRVASQTRRTLRRQRESTSLDGDVDDVAPDSNRPERLLERKQARELLDRALDTLPDELRTVFVLFELEETSTKEIAELLDIPMGTVASRLRRAREEFTATVKRMRGAR
jgi:RNA polymerase sigma-70 factor (ECF subfamily)